MDRKQEQAELIYKLGLLLQPLEEIVAYPDQHCAQSRARAAAKFMHDKISFIRAVGTFARGEPGHIYALQLTRVAYLLDLFESELGLKQANAVG